MRALVKMSEDCCAEAQAKQCVNLGADHGARRGSRVDPLADNAQYQDEWGTRLGCHGPASDQDAVSASTELTAVGHESPGLPGNLSVFRDNRVTVDHHAKRIALQYKVHGDVDGMQCISL
jgi:hypothetical protein